MGDPPDGRTEFGDRARLFQIIDAIDGAQQRWDGRRAVTE
jgi:hypothetical protein